jgi:hypothetical protein
LIELVWDKKAKKEKYSFHKILGALVQSAFIALGIEEWKNFCTAILVLLQFETSLLIELNSCRL